ncbi:hypothetical protein C8J27_106133 [Rhodobacter aestuarii]|uniref:Uncharacterized protein n=1 Tax=Rhodobacter aestuarii TaxID=453582 RepID=A0A1N7M5T9_9RHOB|nr:hypothetical protein [Rhodobacter aestuarii]PTV94865.1 hypothetical protein C8J27_106133 [Rhodobacter aestuarii]SIS81440.1 hypothetical protein SAMN05421580_105133 [Rhodobacter aestuarii]
MRYRAKLRSLLIVASLALCAPALAQTDPTPPTSAPVVASETAAPETPAPAASPVPAAELDTAALAAELARVLALVILIESAMAALFRWRAYRILFNGRALKTPIMFAVGWLVVTRFDYDIVARMLEIAYPGSETLRSSSLSQILSAMVIAGGSSGIADIFHRMGLRTPIAEETRAKVKSETEAWLAILIDRKEAVGDIQVGLRKLTTMQQVPIAGTVGERSFGERFRNAFGLIRLRFPREEGQIVSANIDYEITLHYATTLGGPLSETKSMKAAFAPGALVDLRLTA